MKSILYIRAIFFCLLLSPIGVSATNTFVSSLQEFNSAHDSASANDTITWRSGTYSDIFMDIDKSRLAIVAEELGTVIFNGASRVDISSSGDYVSLIGFQFVGGNIGDDDVINTRGSYNIFNQINIREYTSYKYLRVREESQYCEITYCNFENRVNQADQNILSILVSNNQPGYHKIQYCSFKNFAGGGNDEGVEPIRIGVSTQADFNSRTLVEYCYFTNCDGDGELISSKASQNVYRYNTFDNNTKAELVLRHGSESVVYGNFFLNGKGGVRVREGQDHYIYNNYFYRLDDRAIFLQNEDDDPLDNINIAFNTIIECEDIRLGGDGGSDEPTNVTFANNIFGFSLEGTLFRNATGNETWIGNISSGNLGIPLPSSGMTQANPNIVQNSASFYGLADNSPAIDAAVSGYEELPQFQGMDAIDIDVELDIMKQARPSNISDRDVGCNEFPHNTLIQPFATEENTGPAYNTDMITSVRRNTVTIQDLISVSPNPVIDILNISISTLSVSDLTIEIMNMEGKTVSRYPQSSVQGNTSLQINVASLKPGMYLLNATGQNNTDGIFYSQTKKIVIAE